MSETRNTTETSPPPIVSGSQAGARDQGVPQTPPRSAPVPAAPGAGCVSVDSLDASLILDCAVRSALAGDLPAARAAFAEGRRLCSAAAALNERWLSARAGDRPVRPPSPVDVTRLPVYGFMHIATVNHWDQIVSEQFQRMRDSGLWDKTRRLFVSLAGPQARQCRFVDQGIEIIHAEDNLETAEFPIIRCLHDFCRRTPCLVYYIHTKGVTNPLSSVNDWRRMMEYFIIDRHADCLALLAHHDVCGVNWLDHPWPHFSGNFWWATSRHVARLPAVDGVELGRMSKDVFRHDDRHKTECWIGAHEGMRAACLHWSGVDHYLNPYPADRYVAAAAC